MDRRTSVVLSFLICFSLLLCTLAAHAFDVDQLTESSAPTRPPLSQATPFKVSVSLHDASNTLTFHFSIQEGYHLYGEHMRIETDPELLFGPLELPAGESVMDPLVGTQTLYHRELIFSAPLLKHDIALFTLTVHYQGCKGKIFCLPPQKSTFSVDLRTGLIHEFKALQKNIPQAPPSVFHTALSFLGLGLLLAFSPCVLPMLPIITGMLLGNRQLSLAKNMMLSLSFVLGSASVFTLLGLGAVFLGAALQAWIQTAWFIIPTVLLLILMSLSLLDYLPFYTPYSQGTNIAQPEGSIFRAFCFGLVSGFIFSPCVSAPLMGALVFITTSQDYILGATSLFLLGIGMGIPLIAAAIFGTRILPKRGAWMNQIKVLCAVLLLALSIYLLSRIVTSPIVMTLTGLLALGYGLYLLRITHTRKRILQLIMNVIGAFSLLYGCALFVGVWRGHYNLYHPLQSSTPSETQLPWIAASNAVTLEQELQYAKESGLPSIVDVYASWCIACQHIEQEVIPDEKVQKQLAPFVRIHLDVSQADEATYAWLKAHYVFGPPAQLLFDADGRALTDQTLYGEITITQLIQALERAQH